MASNKKLKKAIRERIALTGESYSTARMHVLHSLGQEDVPPAKAGPLETWLLTVTLGERKYRLASGPLPDGVEALPGLEIGERDLMGEPGSPPWAAFSFPMTECGPICDAIWKGADVEVSIWRGGPFAEGRPDGVSSQLTGKVPKGALDVVYEDYVVRGKVVSTANITYMKPTVVGPEVMRELMRNTRVIQHAFADPKHPPLLDPHRPEQVGGVIEAPDGLPDATLFPLDPDAGLWGRTFFDSNDNVMLAAIIADEHHSGAMPGRSFVMEVPSEAPAPEEAQVGRTRTWRTDDGSLSAVVLEVSPRTVLLRCVENDVTWPDVKPVLAGDVPEHDSEQDTIVVAGVDVPAKPAYAISCVRSKAPWAQEALSWLAGCVEQNGDIRAAVVRNHEWLLAQPGLSSDAEASAAVAACKTLHITRARMWDETLPLRDRVNSAIHLTRLLQPFFEARRIEGIIQA